MCWCSYLCIHKDKSILYSEVYFIVPGNYHRGREEGMPSYPEFSRAGLCTSINPSPFPGMEVGGGWTTACLGR